MLTASIRPSQLARAKPSRLAERIARSSRAGPLQRKDREGREDRSSHSPAPNCARPIVASSLESPAVQVAFQERPIAESESHTDQCLDALRRRELPDRIHERPLADCRHPIRAAASPSQILGPSIREVRSGQSSPRAQIQRSRFSARLADLAQSAAQAVRRVLGPAMRPYVQVSAALRAAAWARRAGGPKSETPGRYHFGSQITHADRLQFGARRIAGRPLTASDSPRPKP